MGWWYGKRSGAISQHVSARLPLARVWLRSCFRGLSDPWAGERKGSRRRLTKERAIGALVMNSYLFSGARYCFQRRTSVGLEA